MSKNSPAELEFFTKLLYDAWERYRPNWELVIKVFKGQLTNWGYNYVEGGWSVDKEQRILLDDKWKFEKRVRKK